MAQPINVAVRCPKCNWRVMDKISPTTGKMRSSAPDVIGSWRSIWPCAGRYYTGRQGSFGY